MTGQVYFEDVGIGDPMSTLSVTVDETQMFFFSAATCNGHRIHYDKAWATEVEGYPDILVQGPLQAALLARAITDWAGPSGRLVSYAIQNRASAYPGERLRFAGIVTAKHEDGNLGLVDLRIRGEKDEADGVEVLMPGTATVCLPRRS
jgi:hydroxyacyl-ACP dehydratase HTD2-like protein with hotdog domain